MKKTVLTFLFAVATAASTFAGDVVPFNSMWSYLNPTIMAENPGTIDANFDANWFKAGFNLNSPNQWSGPSQSPFVRSDDPLASNISAFTPGNSSFVREAKTWMPVPISGERLTSYFRHEFTLDSATSNLGLRFLVDDGAQFYLDGQPLISHNCCKNEAGDAIADNVPKTYTDLALTSANERAYVTTSLNRTLSAGPHVLSASVHSRSRSDSDMGFSVRMFDDYVYETLMEPGGDYRYTIGFEDPSPGTLDWTTSAFDDGRWDVGKEGFGYDSGDAENVNDLVVTDVIEMAGQFSTLYLRREINIADPTKYSQIEFQADYDDGFIVYLNGQEVTRVGVPGDPGVPVEFDVLATGHESSNGSGAPPESFFADISPGLLIAGANQLAILGVNQTFDSSDFLLDRMTLIGIGGDTGEVASASGDLDGSGFLDAADIDLLSAAVRAGDNSPQFDLNGDGVVNGADRTMWIDEIKNTYIGDANLDGEFSTSDFVQVFQASQFEDGIPGNSTWATGDWDGDGDFGTSDFVGAFQSQGFEIGPKPGGVNPAQPVPEPTASLPLFLLTVVSVLGLRKRQN